jgi:endonuclease/exonuclease/phosphatase family metal-dependent hydrolase
MLSKWKQYGMRLVSALQLFLLLLLAVSALAPYLNPAQWWPIALLGLVFPLLFVAALVSAIVWLFVQKRKAIPAAIVLIVCLPSLVHSFAFHAGSKFDNNKSAGTLRVISWNVGLMNYMAPDTITARANNRKILDALQKADADVVCLQEFFTAVQPGNYYNLIDSISKTLGYPHHFFAFDYPKFNGSFYSGSIIFSKYAIVDTGKLVYDKPFAGSIIRAGIVVGADTIDVFTTRLQSVHFGNNEYRILNSLKKGGDGDLSGSKNLVRKLKFGYHERAAQVQVIREMMSASTRKHFFTGDLNDVPSGYTYRQVRGAMEDAWLKKGFGLGRTFRLIFPTLRIDYIFYDKGFSCRQTSRIQSGGSDHHGIIADLTVQRQP